MQQAKVKSYSVFEIVYGDSASGYITAVSYDNYEAIGKGHPFQTALGEDGARKLEAKVAGIVSHVERFISRSPAGIELVSNTGLIEAVFRQPVSPAGVDFCAGRRDVQPPEHVSTSARGTSARPHVARRT